MPNAPISPEKSITLYHFNLYKKSNPRTLVNAWRWTGTRVGSDKSSPAAAGGDGGPQRRGVDGGALREVVVRGLERRRVGLRLVVRQGAELRGEKIAGE